MSSPAVTVKMLREKAFVGDPSMVLSIYLIPSGRDGVNIEPVHLTLFLMLGIHPSVPEPQVTTLLSPTTIKLCIYSNGKGPHRGRKEVRFRTS